MKKIFLILLATTLTFSLNSCSKDDDSNSNGSNGNGKSTISFKYDGVQKTLNDVNVVKDAPDSEGDILLTVSGTNGPTNAMSFGLWQGGLGTDAVVTEINLLLAGDAFHESNGFVIYVTKNTANHLEGTFSGDIYLITSGATHTITEGTFNINY